MEHKDFMSAYDAMVKEASPMTNDQQAYDRAMAHNALLREALGSFETDCITRPYDGGWNIDVFNVELWMNERSKTLNATEADAEVWANVYYGCIEREANEAKQQLATVTNERDALRDALGELVALKNHKDTVGKDPDYTRRQPKAWEQARIALAQKGGEG